MKKIANLALALGFILPLAGCPGDDGEDDTAGTPTTTMPTTTMDPSSGTMDPTMDPDSSSSGGGNGGAGACAPTCMEVADCVPPMGDEADYACNDMFCEFIGELPDPPPCDDTICPPAAGGVCAPVNGVEICTFPCPGGQADCDALMQECTGQDDNGNDICEFPPPPPCGGAAEGEPCNFGQGQSGVCQTDGSCTCADDTECGVEGQACNPNAGG